MGTLGLSGAGAEVMGAAGGAHSPLAELLLYGLVGLPGHLKLEQNRSGDVIFSRTPQTAMSGCRQSELRLFTRSVA